MRGGGIAFLMIWVLLLGYRLLRLLIWLLLKPQGWALLGLGAALGYVALLLGNFGSVSP